MDVDERIIPGVSANFMFMQGMSRYLFAAKYINKHSNILDLGCGTGYGTSLLAKRSKLSFGIDKSSDAIIFAKNKYAIPNKLNYIQWDIQKPINFLPNKFDLITCFETIEHLSRPSQLLSLITKQLNPKGVLIVSTPNRLISSPNGKLSSPYHIVEYSPIELKNLLGKYFNYISLFGQTFSPKAESATTEFLNSQTIRQKLVDMDLIKIRKLFPKSLKEFIWRYFGNFLGRGPQEKLTYADFPITKTNVNKSHYIIAVCSGRI